MLRQGVRTRYANHHTAWQPFCVWRWDAQQAFIGPRHMLVDQAALRYIRYNSREYVCLSPSNLGMVMTPALILDRDGVVNRDTGYVYRIEDVEFINGIFETCHVFQQSGFRIVIVTNQSGIARGLYTERDFNQLMIWMRQCFEAHGVGLDGVYYCPHHPAAAIAAYAVACACRKPNPGMMTRAAQELELDLARSILVGDKRSDLEAGRRAGIGKVVLVRSGQSLASDDKHLADGVLDSLGDTAGLIQVAQTLNVDTEGTKRQKT
jgi:D-glycero-D-manno-heptose 1,7-bisphosphate phosphatase